MPSKIKGELAPIFMFFENAFVLGGTCKSNEESKTGKVVLGVKDIFLPFHMMKLWNRYSLQKQQGQ